MNVSINSSAGALEEKWFIANNTARLLSIAIGGSSVLLNFYALAILSFCDVAINAAAVVLLKSQLWFDGLGGVCLVINEFQPLMKTLNVMLNNTICLLLKQRLIMWIFYVSSVYNIVAVAIQRFAITFYPLKPITVKQTYILLFFVIIAAMFLAIGHDMIIFARTTVGFCDSRFHQDTGDVINILWFIGYYFTPVVLILSFYTKVIFKLKDRDKIQSTSKKHSESRLLKNAISVAVIFIITTGLSSWSYLFVSFKIIEASFWDKNIKLVSHIFVMLNSASTPITYFVFLPALRGKTVIGKICNCRQQ